MKNIAILGSTGSIGTQALDVVRANPDLYRVNAISAQQNADLLIAQALEFNPKLVVIVDERQYQKVKTALPHCQVSCGLSALEELATWPDTELLLTAVVGAVGLKPTLAAIQSGKDIALANKETLVIAGELVMDLARQKGVKIIPVDSEHSAIFQCLVGERNDAVEKIILTASGGPFRGKDKKFLQHVDKEAALKHPNWSMGAKITIDSASLMNKGLEAIEAKWLFDVEVEQLEVVVHPQSIIHSLVQFKDGSIKAQMGLPDMKLPIHYALAYPERLSNNFRRFDFMDYASLTFEKPDMLAFPNLGLALQALQIGGNAPAVLNAANEVVVEAFLQDQIGFLQMSDIIANCMQKVEQLKSPSLDEYLESDKLSRILAAEMVTGINKK